MAKQKLLSGLVGNASKRCRQGSVTLGGVTHYLVTLGGVTHYLVTLGSVTQVPPNLGLSAS